MVFLHLRIERFGAFVLVFGLFIFEQSPAFADISEPTGDNTNTQLDQIINSCVTAAVRDPICDGLVKLRNVGDDFIESVKEFVDLTPRQYFILTLANATIQQRVRFRTRASFLPDGQFTLDLKEDESTAIVEFSF